MSPMLQMNVLGSGGASIQRVGHRVAADIEEAAVAARVTDGLSLHAAAGATGQERFGIDDDDIGHGCD